MLNIAVVAPIPSARIEMASSANPGDRLRLRIPSLSEVGITQKTLHRCCQFPECDVQSKSLRTQYPRNGFRRLSFGTASRNRNYPARSRTISQHPCWARCRSNSIFTFSHSSRSRCTSILAFAIAAESAACARSAICAAAIESRIERSTSRLDNLLRVSQCDFGCRALTPACLSAEGPRNFTHSSSDISW